ncbi:MAG: TlpA family protein disulfide reductase [Bacteroidales bacterium]|nr:TlpA family protein disulfide reductase [Bacteroidales bacterium]
MKHLMTIAATLILATLQAVGQTPDFKALREQYNWRLPVESFHDDTVVICGRITNYDPATLPFSTMQCFSYDEFERQTAASADIKSDGSFETKIRLSYPVVNHFGGRTDKNIYPIPFIAYPGDTVEVDITFNGDDYTYDYKSERCKRFERLLPYPIEWARFAAPALMGYNGGFDDFANAAEDLWNKVLTRVLDDARQAKFTDEEMGLALVLAQGNYGYGLFNGIGELSKLPYEQKIEGQYMYLTLKDSTLLERMKSPDNYKYLTHIDFNDPSIFCADGLSTILNRIEYGLIPYDTKKNIDGFYPPRGVKNCKKFFPRADSLLQKALFTQGSSPIAQMVMYQHLLFFIDNPWTDMPADNIKDIRDNILPVFTFAPIKRKVESLFANRLADTEITLPLKKCAATAFIDSLRQVYPGKYLYLDFWAMSCGPCRMTIEHSKDMRKEIANNPDIKLVFVNGDNPNNARMLEYVDKHLADEVTVAPGESVFATLRDVFNFAGIPHFEVITPDGQVVKERYIKFGLRESGDYNHFKSELDKLKNLISQ